MPQYRKRPVIVDAIKWTGLNHKEIDAFIDPLPDKPRHWYNKDDKALRILTPESNHGAHTASIGDMIIKGIKDDWYPCKPDIFEMTYEEVT